MDSSHGMPSGGEQATMLISASIQCELRPRKPSYHLGDLPNLLAIEGRKGSLHTITNRTTISDGLTTRFDQDGSAFSIPESEDKFLPDPPTKDASGGARIAYGVNVKEEAQGKRTPGVVGGRTDPMMEQS